jgi:hypothetical protein
VVSGPTAGAIAFYGGVEIVGLAGQQHDVIRPALAPVQDRLHLLRDVAFGAPDHESVALQRFSARGPDEERHVGAALLQPATDVAADRAGAQDESLHFRAPPINPFLARRAS